MEQTQPALLHSQSQNDDSQKLVEVFAEDVQELLRAFDRHKPIKAEAMSTFYSRPKRKPLNLSRANCWLIRK